MCVCVFVYVFLTQSDRVSTIPIDIRRWYSGVVLSARQKKVRGHLQSSNERIVAIVCCISRMK